MDKLTFDMSELLYKHKIGVLLDEADSDRLRDWRAASTEHQKLFETLSACESFAVFAEQIERFDVDRGWNRLLKKQQRKSLNLQLVILKYAAIVAVVVVLFGGVYFFCFVEKGPLVVESAETLISPGSAKAILTISSGEQFELEDDSVLSADEIAEFHSMTQSGTAIAEQKISTIEVPIGGEYRLMLSDGTSVYLNSQTVLRFPERFSEDRRQIELIQGEIYLDVRPDADAPFYVYAPEMCVKVFGTSFNLSMYDGLYQTTLIEGSVEVQIPRGEVYLLTPSDQLSFSSGSRDVEIKKVDRAYYTAWVDGRIAFKDETIEQIMKSLSRWYGFEVVFANPSVKNYRFGVYVNKYEQIDPLLEMLEATEKVHFKIEEKVIYVNGGAAAEI